MVKRNLLWINGTRGTNFINYPRRVKKRLTPLYFQGGKQLAGRTELTFSFRDISCESSVTHPKKDFFYKKLFYWES